MTFIFIQVSRLTNRLLIVFILNFIDPRWLMCWILYRICFWMNFKGCDRLILLYLWIFLRVDLFTYFLMLFYSFFCEIPLTVFTLCFEILALFVILFRWTFDLKIMLFGVYLPLICSAFRFRFLSLIWLCRCSIRYLGNLLRLNTSNLLLELTKAFSKYWFYFLEVLF